MLNISVIKLAIVDRFLKNANKHLLFGSNIMALYPIFIAFNILVQFNITHTTTVPYSLETLM